jgi:hypothetical protein
MACHRSDGRHNARRSIESTARSAGRVERAARSLDAIYRCAHIDQDAGGRRPLHQSLAVERRRGPTGPLPQIPRHSLSQTATHSRVDRRHRTDSVREVVFIRKRRPRHPSKRAGSQHRANTPTLNRESNCGARALPKGRKVVRPLTAVHGRQIPGAPFTSDEALR